MTQNSDDASASHATKAARWVAVPFILIAFVSLLRARWFDAAFFLFFGIFFLIEMSAVRLPKWAERLVVAAFVVLAVVKFVRLIGEFQALQNALH